MEYLLKNRGVLNAILANITFICKILPFVFLCFEIFLCFFFIFSVFSIDKLVKILYHIYCIDVKGVSLGRFGMESTKIRMIFCDVDGTLLPRGVSQISEDTFSVIKKAVSSNIYVCIASGRSYPDLKELFAPVKNDVTFICNDGASVIRCDNVLYSSPLDKSMVKCMSKTYKNDYKAMAIYAKDYTYYISDTDDNLPGQKITSENILAIPGNIFKVAFYGLSERAKIKIDNLGVKAGILNKVYNDPNWTEYIKSNTNKGVATEYLQKHFNCSASQTAAFGDNLNDLEMLRRARVSFAMENGNAEVLRMCKYKTNNVSNEILNIIEKGERYE